MNRLEPQQIEKLQEISNQLRQQRESKDITLEQLAARTYIPLRALRALDAGQAEQLPEPIFVQGFIRRYGEAVGLNGVKLAQEFPTEIAPPPPPQPVEPEPQSQAENKFAIAPGDWQKPTAIAVGALMGLGLLGWGLVALLTPDKPTPVTRTQPSPISQPSPSATQPAAPVPARPQPAAKIAPVEAAVKVTQEAWVQVTVDGKSAFEGTLPQGSQKTWTAQQQITLLTGNAGGVNVAVNRGPAKPLGEVGEVKEVKLTPPASATPTSRL